MLCRVRHQHQAHHPLPSSTPLAMAMLGPLAMLALVLSPCSLQELIQVTSECTIALGIIVHGDLLSYRCIPLDSISNCLCPWTVTKSWHLSCLFVTCVLHCQIHTSMLYLLYAKLVLGLLKAGTHRRFCPNNRQFQYICLSDHQQPLWYTVWA